MEFRKGEDKVIVLRKANMKKQREVKVKNEVAARLETEKAEGSKKHGQEDGEREISVTVRLFLMEHGVKWMVKEGVICDSCEKKEKKCFWRMEARWGEAFLVCHDLKKSCVAGGAEKSEMEASLSKKWKVEGKGKGKAKAGTLVSRVAESVVVDVLQDILMELKGWHAEVGDLCVFAQHTISITESSRRIWRQMSACVNKLCHHVMPEEDDKESSRAENEEGGGDGEKNEETHNGEMRENGANMVDDALDETLH